MQGEQIVNNIIYDIVERSERECQIDRSLYERYDVKRGLRNSDGTGVLVGLTKIGDVRGYEKDLDGSPIPINGELYYRNYEITTLINKSFEEVVYLLLSGSLPNEDIIRDFRNIIYENMILSHNAIARLVEYRGADIMNILQRTVLDMYNDDRYADNIDKENLIRQSIHLISSLPTIVAYAYNIRNGEDGIMLRQPKREYSLAENFLWMLHGEFTPLEAKMLNMLMIVQAEHGGGNNSTFTVRVQSSSCTDTYSSISAGIGSLKGPLHGGANMKACSQFNYIKKKHYEEGEHLEDIIRDILRSGEKIYGIGHAVYTLSDPRAELLRDTAHELALKKDMLEDFNLLLQIESISKRVIQEKTKKEICTNLDFFSSFIYRMLNIDEKLFTPIFAMSRISGWCSHRIEEITMREARIIRPAYQKI